MRIPESSTLVARLNELVKSYKDVRDASTGKLLLGDKAMEGMNGVLASAEGGMLSDPAGVNLYQCRGTDNDELPLHYCIRGTNSSIGISTR